MLKNLTLLMVIGSLFLVGCTPLNKNCEEGLTSLRNNLSLMQEEKVNLANNLSLMQEEKVNLANKLSELNETLDTLKKEISYLKTGENLIEEIKQFRENLASSWDWYESNSKLGNSTIEELAKKRISGANIYEIKNDQCIIDPRDIGIVNEYYLQLYYSESQFLKNDGILSIQQTLRGDNLDCEDFALLFRAELNYVIDKCKSEGASEIIIQTHELGSNFDYKTYTYSGYNHPTIICGRFHNIDYSTEKHLVWAVSKASHCLVAISKNEVKNISTIKNLQDSLIFEPQDGGYWGKFNSKYRLFFPTKNNIESDLGRGLFDSSFSEEDTLDSYILLVISDDDLYNFDRTNYEWKSINNFKKSISEFID